MSTNERPKIDLLRNLHGVNTPVPGCGIKNSRQRTRENIRKTVAELSAELEKNGLSTVDAAEQAMRTFYYEGR